MPEVPYNIPIASVLAGISISLILAALKYDKHRGLLIIIGTGLLLLGISGIVGDFYIQPPSLKENPLGFLLIRENIIVFLTTGATALTWAFKQAYRRSPLIITGIIILGLSFVTSLIFPSIPEETLIVPFTRTYCPATGEFNGVLTSHDYQGKVTITVTGIGQATAQWTDAFFTFIQWNGKPMTPAVVPQNAGGVLWINHQPAYGLLQPHPVYNPDHSYTFTFDAPGGQLSFAIGDCFPDNNDGSYIITII